MTGSSPQLRGGVAFATIVVLLFAAAEVSAFPSGAPVTACGTLTPMHFSSQTGERYLPTQCGPSCPFSLALTAIDGEAPPPGPVRYRCGALHTIRLESNDGSTFRGFVVQSRERTPSFTPISNFVGSFMSPPPNALWEVWNCDGPSATHESRVDKTAVDLTWRAPGFPSTTNATMWFSVVRVMSTFHVQLRGLDLSPDPEFCAPPPPEPVRLNFINSSPRVDGNTISADIQIAGGPPQTVLCALSGLPYQDCSSGSVTFTNVPLRGENNRPYILRAAANTTDGLRTVIRTAVRVTEPNICSVHLVNDGVTVSGNSATVEYSINGPTGETACSLDRGELVPCISGQTVFTDLSVGPHRLKIVPSIRDCGRNRRPMVVSFLVEGQPA